MFRLVAQEAGRGVSPGDTEGTERKNEDMEEEASQKTNKNTEEEASQKTNEDKSEKEARRTGHEQRTSCRDQPRGSGDTEGPATSQKGCG
ncbi:hypothetical protein NDU88_008191 [Pleurodeles waltl]|uniref:Uncharacterized protein n=1 Tax=Pleurodeles waltl TaxID=8319 RepID=A0AAV7NV82_PLEWA|nr:hypothetical protein NDU88_008191 [Pleurodeles waltl]